MSNKVPNRKALRWIDTNRKKGRMLLEDTDNGIVRRVGSYFFNTKEGEWECSRYRSKDDRTCAYRFIRFSTEEEAKKYVVDTPADHTS